MFCFSCETCVILFCRFPSNSQIVTFYCRNYLIPVHISAVEEMAELLNGFHDNNKLEANWYTNACTMCNDEKNEACLLRVLNDGLQRHPNDLVRICLSADQGLNAWEFIILYIKQHFDTSLNIYMLPWSLLPLSDWFFWNLLLSYFYSTVNMMLTLQLLFYCFIICWSVCPSMKRLHKFSIFTFVGWALYKVYCGSFCMNRTTFREPWVGGVLVKTCIIALRRSTFLKEKQIHNVIKFSFLLGLTDL